MSPPPVQPFDPADEETNLPEEPPPQPVPEEIPARVRRPLRLVTAGKSAQLQKTLAHVFYPAVLEAEALSPVLELPGGPLDRRFLAMAHEARHQHSYLGFWTDKIVAHSANQAHQLEEALQEARNEERALEQLLLTLQQRTHRNLTVN